MKIKKILLMVIIAIFIVTLAGCKGKESKKKVNDVSKAQEDMMSKLDNFAITATITTKTGFLDVDIHVNCIKDNKNQIEYCKTSTLGLIEMEQYVDYKNKKEITKTTALFGGDENNGKWVTQKFSESSSITNSWLSLNDCLSKLEMTEQNGGKLYKGEISTSDINKAISKSDTGSKISTKGSNKNIPIEVFINSDGYIEKLNTEFEFSGMKEVIELKYSSFNTAGSLTIPNI